MYGLLQADTEKTARTGTVHQQVFPVAGADKRGDAGKCRGTAFVGLADIQCGSLHQVLQQGHFGCAEFVEFIQIDQTAGGRTYFSLILGGCSPAGGPRCWYCWYPAGTASIGRRVPASSGGNRSPIPGRRTPGGQVRIRGPCRPIREVVQSRL